MLGTALAVKLLLHVASGPIVAVAEIRTATRARARLVEHLHARLPMLAECLISEVGR